MTDVQNASRSKRRVVPYSKDISETILLDSVIFHNVYIFFLLNKAALMLIRHCPTKYSVQKKIMYFKNFWASSSVFCTKKIVKYFIVLTLKPTLVGSLYIKKTQNNKTKQQRKTKTPYTTTNNPQTRNKNPKPTKKAKSQNKPQPKQLHPLPPKKNPIKTTKTSAPPKHKNPPTTTITTTTK